MVLQVFSLWSKEFQLFQLEQLLKVSIVKLLGHLIYLCIYCNES